MPEPAQSRSALTGAVFLMATAAVGPGFITQTAVFTGQLKSDFGFVILCSILLDIFAQLNIWRIITVSGKRAQDIANEVLPGLGYLLMAAVAFGGLAFNIGNVAGAGLGLNLLIKVDSDPNHPVLGVILSTVLSLLIFGYREATRLMDGVTRVMGLIMIALTLLVAWMASPPLGDALKHSVAPERVNGMAILTLVGGTVGGYISFAGAHRLLDAGYRGTGAVRPASLGSVRAILLASVMRILLFLAALGVVTAGISLDPGNPAADVFGHALGNTGRWVFGLVLWCASITSIIAAAYTSVSFIRTLHPQVEKRSGLITAAFILLSCIIYLAIGRPVTVLVLAGTVNGFILPLALGILLWKASRHHLAPGYRHPVWMTVAGWLVVVLTAALAVATLI